MKTNKNKNIYIAYVYMHTSNLTHKQSVAKSVIQNNIEFISNVLIILF